MLLDVYHHLRMMHLSGSLIIPEFLHLPHEMEKIDDGFHGIARAIEELVPHQIPEQNFYPCSKKTQSFIIDIIALTLL